MKATDVRRSGRALGLRRVRATAGPTSILGTKPGTASLRPGDCVRPWKTFVAGAGVLGVLLTISVGRPVNAQRGPMSSGRGPGLQPPNIDRGTEPGFLRRMIRFAVSSGCRGLLALLGGGDGGFVREDFGAVAFVPVVRGDLHGEVVPVSSHFEGVTGGDVAGG